MSGLGNNNRQGSAKTCKIAGVNFVRSSFAGGLEQPYPLVKKDRVLWIQTQSQTHASTLTVAPVGRSGDQAIVCNAVLSNQRQNTITDLSGQADFTLQAVE